MILLGVMHTMHLSLVNCGVIRELNCSPSSIYSHCFRQFMPVGTKYKHNIEDQFLIDA